MIKFNIIGFGPRNRYYKWMDDEGWDGQTVYRHCVFHPGTRLIPKKGENDLLWCPKCGATYNEEKDEALKDEDFDAEYSPQAKTRIISAGKKKKKYYDKQGNLITDPTLINDIQRGMNVIWYNEQKSGEEKRHIVKNRTGKRIFT